MTDEDRRRFPAPSGAVEVRVAFRQLVEATRPGEPISPALVRLNWLLLLREEKISQATYTRALAAQIAAVARP